MYEIQYINNNPNIININQRLNIESKYRKPIYTGVRFIKKTKK
jgi:hypothetical protein